jgi:acetolactate synthase regulatory subunit
VLNRVRRRTRSRTFSEAQSQATPIYQAEKFSLTVNMKTARALELAIPQALLTRADEVIE